MKSATKKQINFSLQWLKSPIVILLSLVLAIIAGTFYPSFSKTLAPIGDTYLKLLQMTIIPILMTALIASVGKLCASESARESIFKIVTTSLIFLFVVSGVTLVISLVVGPGRYLSQEAKIMLGKTLSAADQSGVSVASANRGAVEFIQSMIPSNIFHDLGQGSNLSILFFSLILGVATGLMGGKGAESILVISDGLFKAFFKIISWIMYLLPFGLFAMLANQLAQTGTETLFAMLRFVLIIWGTCLLLIVVNTAVMSLTLRRSPLVILSVMKESMLIAFGTASSFAAMPSTILGLTGKTLQMPSSVINLVIPLGVVLNRFSMVMIYVAASVFAAELYGVPLHAPQILMVLSLSILAAVAGAGAPGVVSLTMVSIVLLPLGLPAQAITVLLIAVLPIIDPITTLTGLYTNSTLSTLIAKGHKDEAEQEQTSEVVSNAR
jgi:proton glutamate symport protein